MNTICDSLFYFHSITFLVSHYFDLGIDKGNVDRRSGSPDHRKTGDATTLGEWLKWNEMEVEKEGEKEVEVEVSWE